MDIKFFLTIIWISALALSFSCQEEKLETEVITEEILYVSGETVRVVGRILSISSDVSSHGFMIDVSENFDNPIVIELGETKKLGRYIGETKTLNVNTQYYCRAFVISNEQMISGNTVELKTLSPFITDFSPKLGFENDILVVDGGNFTSNTEVYFGNVKAEILEFNFESRLVVKVPFISNGSYNVDIDVKVDEDVLSFGDKFEYVTGKWDKVAEFLTADKYDEVLTMYTNESVYFGLGKNSEGQLNPNLWSYDFNTASWNPSSFQTFSRYPYIANNYFGGGAINFVGSKIFTNEFWYFDGSNFIKKADSPFSLYKAIAFDLEDQIIVMGGNSVNGNSNDLMYSYNKSLDEWSFLGLCPFEVLNPAPHFIYQNELYAYNKEESEMWRFNILNSTWESFITVPIEATNGGLASVINNKIYIGLFYLSGTIWELDMTNKLWKEKISYPNSKGDETIGHFSDGNDLYLFKDRFVGANQTAGPIELWKFSPEIR